MCVCVCVCVCVSWGGGGVSMVNPVTCLFLLFEALNDAFKVHFSELNFLHLITDTDSM